MSRIVHMIPFLWSGAGDVVTRLAVSQAAAGDRVVVVTSPDSPGHSDWPVYRERLAAGGVGRAEIELFDRDVDVLARSTRDVRDLLASIEPDIVHCHSGVPAAVASRSRAQGADFRLIGQLHSWGTNRPDWMDRDDLHAFRQCDFVIVNSSDYRRMLCDSGVSPARVGTIPWGLPLDEIDTVRAEKPQRTSGSAIRIGYTGRIERRKRQRVLVESVATMESMGLDATLELIGPVAEDDYATEILGAVRSLGVRDRVLFRGAVPDVCPVVRSWDVFVSPSADEGQGMAVLEAMALEVPVIAGDAAGIRDFLREWDNAMILRHPNAQAIAAAVKWLTENPALARRLAENARVTVEREYGWEKTVSGMRVLYGQLGRVA